MPAPDKTATGKHNNVLGLSGLNGKSITGVDVWRIANMDVIEINYAGGPTYIKFRQGQVDVGGTADWLTGTLAY
jgi:hypothetical protein